MRKLTLIAALAVSLASLSALTSPAFGQSHEHTDLEEKMDVMNNAFRKLRRQIADASANASSLELVAKLREAAEASAKLIPAKAEKVPEADRAKFVADYEAKMKEFLTELDNLKTALEAGKNDEAAVVLGKLGALQKSGHREFRVQKKE